MQRNGAENYKSGGDANLLLPNFYALQALSSQLSVFSKLCIMNTLLHFLVLFQLCRSLRNISLGGRILGKSKVIVTVGWVWRRHQKVPVFSLAPPPILNPPLALIQVSTTSAFNKHAAVHINLKWKLWWPCINKNSLSTVCWYLIERQPNRRVEAG